MFATLFLKECKAILKSTTYYIILICLFVFIQSQLGDYCNLSKPRQDQEKYGYKNSDDPQVIMQETIKQLQEEYLNECYVTYPFGFYKEAKIGEKKSSKVFDLIDHVLAADASELQAAYKKIDGNEMYTNGIGGSLVSTGRSHYEELQLNPLFYTIADDMTFEQFEEDMEQVNKLVGGGSKYAKKSLADNAEIEMTYEDAMNDYESILKEDRVSRAFARVYADYMGIILAILPVFLAVTRAVRDRRSKATEVIYSKRISSFQVVLSRYLATIVMILLPVILLGINPTIQTIYVASQYGVQADVLAFPKVILGWLLPTLLVTVSVGFFFGELTGGPAAILVQAVIWIFSIFGSMGDLVGGVGGSLVPRFNGVGYHDIYEKVFSELVINRMVYALIGILLFVATVFVYQMKRKGVMDTHGTLLRHRKK